MFIPTGLPSKITADGLEITFATNHIGPFLLTSLLLGQTFLLLMLLFQSQKDNLQVTLINNAFSFYCHIDLLKKSAPARIVNVSSMNHWRGEVDFSHFRGDNLSNVMDAAYNHTKLHNVIWTNELARRLQGTGTCTKHFSLH